MHKTGWCASGSEVTLSGQCQGKERAIDFFTDSQEKAVPRAWSQLTSVYHKEEGQSVAVANASGYWAFSVRTQKAMGLRVMESIWRRAIWAEYLDPWK